VGKRKAKAAREKSSSELPSLPKWGGLAYRGRSQKRKVKLSREKAGNADLHQTVYQKKARHHREGGGVDL